MNECYFLQSIIKNLAFIMTQDKQTLSIQLFMYKMQKS
jgi:hypothetical protein